MPAFDTVLIDKDPQHPRIARLVLNRPEKLNAIGETTPFRDPPARSSGPRPTTRCM
jgi:enoyl-CoA hydratase/carnithine racemase